MKLTKTLTTAGTALAVTAASSTSALAQAAPEIEPINNLAESILGFMTGDLARTAGAIAIAFAGYMFWSERWPKSRAITIALGIIVVLGAPTIVEWLDTVA